MRKGLKDFRFTGVTLVIAITALALTVETIEGAEPLSIDRRNRPGPWDQDVLVHRIDTNGVLQRMAVFKRAGVPTVARWKERLIAAHQHFPEDDNANFDKVAVHFLESGKAFTFESMTSYLQQEFRDPSNTGANADQHSLLTTREREILSLIAAGKTNPQIAAQLIIGAGTVKTHTLNIYRKLEVANRTQAIIRAQELGLLSA